MVIYRVENDEGKGPYHCLVAWDDMRSYETCPAPESDYKWLNDLHCCGVYNVFRDKLVFGFLSRDAAFEWFGEKGLKTLEKQGLPLKKFEVGHAIVSDSKRQVMFNREQAKEVP